jgi:sterol desaturase/sphingolipid hydroxylase (fatty acid hydroxylase superfamily)
LRFHFGELLLALPLRLAAVALLGVSIPSVIAFELIFAFTNFVQHGDIDLPGPFAKVMAVGFITPALHRRHHSRETELLNSNYGTIFSIWDRIFGSYVPSASDVQIEIGLPELQHDLGPLDTIMLPARGVFLGR